MSGQSLKRGYVRPKSLEMVCQTKVIRDGMSGQSLNKYNIHSFNTITMGKQVKWKTEKSKL